MSAAGAMSAITFLLFVGITLAFPAFPPASLWYEFLDVPQIELSVWGISIGTLLNGIVNGCFWTIIVIMEYGIAQLARRARRHPLPPMPAAPHLTARLPENIPVDARANSIPPALTVRNTSTVRKGPIRPLIRTESIPVKVPKGLTETELNIETIEGIGPVRGALFRNSGISTVSDLLRMGATQRGRHRLANMVGVTSATVLSWVHRGDLLRVRGIGRKYSALLESAAINTVTDLSTRDPQSLCQTLKAVNMQRNMVTRSPPSKTIEIWIRNAKDLEPILVE